MSSMSDVTDLNLLQTEGQNSKSVCIDQVSTLEICSIINDEDSTVSSVVKKCLLEIAQVIDVLVDRFRQGGRVIYVGAGTSGRLGVLDASEVPPTFSASPERFIALIAGGDVAIRHAQEGAEDNVQAAVTDMQSIGLGKFDSLLGIAASGRTPYVLSCMHFAKSVGCTTIGLACSHPSQFSRSVDVDYMIAAVTGSEVITGSTRMKAGTATKLILNMISTGIMIKLGKTYGNLMVDLRSTNVKLRQRSRKIIRKICGPQSPQSDTEIDAILENCGGSVKFAVATIMLQCSRIEATQRLADAGGVLSNILRSQQDTNDKFVLCVDGGGSKCIAVIAGEHGFWQGEAGPCNATYIGVEGAVSAVLLAVKRALDASPALRGKPLESVKFSRIWIGLAGHDRKPIADGLKSNLTRIFSVTRNGSFELTNDIELIVRPAASRHKLKNVICLVSGTGSIAMSYQRQGDKLVKTGRSGGWGHLLGDDGSGFDIGRRGVRSALKAIDKGHSMSEFSSLLRDIVKYFDPEGQGNSSRDILSSILTPGTAAGKSEMSQQSRIAGAARVVVNASKSSEEAKLIVKEATKGLAELIIPLLPNIDVDQASTDLVLAGGLMQSDQFLTILESTLIDMKLQFRQTEIVTQPAVSGARYLLSQLEV